MKALALALIVSFALPAQVLAQPRPRRAAADTTQAETLAEQAKTAFRAGQFEAAAKLFMEAYAVESNPALVFNAARAYEEAGMRGDAAGLFRLYLTLSQDPDGIADARGRLDKLQAGQAPEPAPAPDKADTAPVAGLSDDATPTMRILPAATAGTAMLALAAGTTLMLMGSAATEDANAGAKALGPQQYGRAYDSAETQWWTGAGLVGLGAALGGVATWLYFGGDTIQVRPTAQGVVLVGKL